MQFLRDNGMDFQKWVYEGVTYCNAAAEEKMRARYFDEQEPQAVDKKKKYPPLKLTRAVKSLLLTSPCYFLSSCPERLAMEHCRWKHVLLKPLKRMISA